MLSIQKIPIDMTIKNSFVYGLCRQRFEFLGNGIPVLISSDREREQKIVTAVCAIFRH